MITRNLEFKSGHVLLHGKLALVSLNSPTVIFIPGSSGGAIKEKFNWLSIFFTSLGYNFFRFNFRSDELTKSIKEYSLDDEVFDIKQAIRMLEKININVTNMGVITKSLGALRLVALKEPRIKCVGMLSPAITISTVSNLENLICTKYEFISHFSDFHINSDYLPQAATVIFYGLEDTTIHLKDVEKLLKCLNGPKELVVINNDAHGLEQPLTHKIIKNKLAEFFANNLSKK